MNDTDPLHEITMPTYPGTDREFRPGDRCRLTGPNVDPTHEITVDQIVLDRHGWSIYDTDGNDRPPEANHLIGWKVTARPADPPVEPLTAELVASGTNAQAAITYLAAQLAAGVGPFPGHTQSATDITRLARLILDRWPE